MLENLYENLAKELKIYKYITLPITTKQDIIWDEGNPETSPVNLLNGIWTITMNEILRTRDPDNIPDYKN